MTMMDAGRDPSMGEGGWDVAGNSNFENSAPRALCGLFRMFEIRAVVSDFELSDGATCASSRGLFSLFPVVYAVEGERKSFSLQGCSTFDS